MTNETHAEQQVPQSAEQIRCAIYARSASAPNPESIADQLKRCRAAAQTLGWTVVEDLVLADEGRSGNSLNGRLGMELLLWLATQKPRFFDCILCADPSRFARDMRLACDIIGSLHRSGVYVYFADAGLDSRSESFRSMAVQGNLADQAYVPVPARRPAISGAVENIFHRTVPDQR